MRVGDLLHTVVRCTKRSKVCAIIIRSEILIDLGWLIQNRKTNWAPSLKYFPYPKGKTFPLFHRAWQGNIEKYEYPQAKFRIPQKRNVRSSASRGGSTVVFGKKSAGFWSPREKPKDIIKVSCRTDKDLHDVGIYSSTIRDVYQWIVKTGPVPGRILSDLWSHQKIARRGL